MEVGFFFSAITRMAVNTILDGFGKLKVLVVGDIMLDRYIHGRVDRVSPEAPVPVVEWGSEVNRLGGAANVALNTMALGATTYLCGVLGKDEPGSCFTGLLESAGMEHQWIVQSPDRQTTVKTRIIAGNQHLLRLDTEATHDLIGEDENKVLENVSALLSSKKIDIIILQDYNKGVLSENIISAILDLARANKTPVSVDPKFRNFWKYKGVSLFKPNLKEIRGALPFPVSNEEHSLQRAANRIEENLHNGLTLITLSDGGVFARDAAGSLLVPTSKRLVADVCGAGDAVIAITSLALALGADISEIANLANLAGGQVVEKVGVVPVDLVQLKIEFRDRIGKLEMQ